VFGNPAAAKARQLSIIVAGAGDHCERSRPLIESLGRMFVVGSLERRRCHAISQPGSRSHEVRRSSVVLNGREKTFSWDKVGHDASVARKP
jgi:hypothetical protein